MPEKVGIVYDVIFSPLVNLKNYISMSSFNTLTPAQRAKINKLGYFLEQFSCDKVAVTNILARDFALVKKSDYSLWKKLIAMDVFEPQRVNPHEREV